MLSGSSSLLRSISRLICNYVLYLKIIQKETIFNERWDNLIILDGCRYDTFKEILKNIPIKGKLKFKISKGSDTFSFLQENFKTYHEDIVYITANPFVNKLLKNKVFKIVSSWKYGWDETLNNVAPWIVYQDALITLRKYPNKRLIVHFSQPHSPYPNRTGETCTKEDWINIVQGRKLKSKYKIDEGTYTDWHYVDVKLLPIKKLKEGYVQNLKLVFPWVKKLVRILPGKTIITSDHGECFGEKLHPLLPLRIYGHPRGFKFPVLVKVPWFIVKVEKEEIDIHTELKKLKRVFMNEESEEDLIRERLKILGYI